VDPSLGAKKIALKDQRISPDNPVMSMGAPFRRDSMTHLVSRN
jgi:hypothetical protein